MTETSSESEPQTTNNVNDDEEDCSVDNAINEDDAIFKGDFPGDIHERYIPMAAVLGEGSFGVVRKCKNKQTGEICALKTIDKSKLPDNAIQLRREIDILLDVDHPHIIKLYDVYEDETSIYLVSELCSGGELYDRVIEKTKSKEGHFSEFTAARIIKNILSAIQYCHDEKQIVHRDLKPENFLLTDETDDAQIKVIDFGLSRYSANRMQSQVGTIYYVAPEVLVGDYTDKADIWSIGVVAYVLLCGFPPFNAGTEKLTYNIVQEGAVKFPSPAWDRTSPKAIRFIKRLLEKDPDTRPSATEAIQDPWLQSEHVHPFKKKWHGTFLHVRSPEAQAMPTSSLVVHTDEEKQNTFERFLSRKRHDKSIFKTFFTKREEVG